MANVTYTKFIGEYEEQSDIFDLGSTALQTEEPQTAIYVDADGGEQMIFEGSGFAYAFGNITDGRVETIVFKNGDGEVVLSIDGLDIGAAKLDSTIASGGIDVMLAKIYAGRDTFHGSKVGDIVNAGAGADRIIGGKGEDGLAGEAGNDRLTGGGDSDQFVFRKGYDKDTITDFDANGGGHDQDYVLIVPEAEFNIVKHGRDTIIDFGHGDTLTLLDVRKSDVSEADFQRWL